MLVRDFLTVKEFDEEEPTYVQVDPLVQFAYIVGEDGNPKRVQSMSRIVVPVYEWDLSDENDILFRTMYEASKSHLVRARNLADLNRSFWANRGYNLKAFALHPDLKDKFFIPEKTSVFYTEEVDPNRILCLGPKETAGILVLQGQEKGFIANNPKGLLSVLISNPK